MKAKLSLRPIFNKVLSQTSQIKLSSYVFSYSDGAKKVDLSTEEITNSIDIVQSIVVVDNYNVWNVDEHGIIIERKIEIGNPDALFGLDGLVSNEAELGLAFRVMSQSSNRHSVYPMTSLTKNQTGSISYNLKLPLKPHKYFGNVLIEPIFYLKKAPSSSDSDFPFDEIEGTILGSLDKIVISFDGVGSVFPIFEYREKNSLLWQVYFNSIELLSDPFAKDYVEILINQLHPDYPLLCVDANLAFTPLFNELISSALSQIIEKARNSDDWSEIVDGEDLESGTIGYAINYFKNVLGWDLADPIVASKSIRLFFSGGNEI